MINARVVSVLKLYVKGTNQKALQFWCMVSSLRTWKPVKECFNIQVRGPQKCEAPSICLVCRMVNPALITVSIGVPFESRVPMYDLLQIIVQYQWIIHFSPKMKKIYMQNNSRLA